MTATLVADAGGTQPLRNQYLHLVGQAGTTNSVTLRANQKAQLDIQLRTKKNPWDAGDNYASRGADVDLRGRPGRLLRLRLHDLAHHHLSRSAATAAGQRADREVERPEREGATTNKARRPAGS